MSDAVPEMVFVPEVAEPVAEVAPVAEPVTELPNVSAETAADSAPETTAAPVVGVEDLNHVHMGFLQVSVREGVTRLEALIAKLGG